MRLLRALLLTALFAATPMLVSAQTGLPCSDPHVASDDEAKAASDGGIIAGKTLVCPNDARLGISDTVGEAKKYLLSIARPLPGTHAPPDESHIANLNNTFAVCAANFLKAYTARYGGVTLSSAFRCGPNSPASISCNRSENGASGGATNSNHQLGLAADVSPTNGNFQQIWAFAKANPQFGVCFPYLGGDRPHMALAGTGTGEASKCAAQGITQACSGAPAFDIKSVPAGFGNAGYSDEGGYPQTFPNSSLPYSPTAPLATGFSSGLSMTPQITPSSYATNPATNPALSTTPTQNVCSPSFSCSNNVQYYQTSSCTSQVYQVCSNGCNGNVCAAASSTGNYINNSFSTSSTSTDSNTNTNTNTNVNSNGNVSDILNSIATNFSAVSIATSSSIAFSLNPDTGEVGQIKTEGAATSGLSSGGIGVISSVQPTVGGQQTFTSGDLTGSGTLGGTQNRGGLAAVLASMRSALEWAIKVLTPFGGTPRTTY